jgi:hypothetical protein
MMSRSAFDLDFASEGLVHLFFHGRLLLAFTSFSS